MDELISLSLEAPKTNQVLVWIDDLSTPLKEETETSNILISWSNPTVIVDPWEHSISYPLKFEKVYEFSDRKLFMIPPTDNMIYVVNTFVVHIINVWFGTCKLDWHNHNSHITDINPNRNINEIRLLTFFKKFESKEAKFTSATYRIYHRGDVLQLTQQNQECDKSKGTIRYFVEIP